MQHDDGRRLIRRGTDHAVFEIGGADAKEAGWGEGWPWCFPFAVRHAPDSVAHAEPVIPDIPDDCRFRPTSRFRVLRRWRTRPGMTGIICYSPSRNLNR